MSKKKHIYQLSKINKSLKKVKDHQIRERLLILKDYYQGQSMRNVADHHQCSHGKVKYWKDIYEQKGVKGLETIYSNGAPTKLSQDQAAKLKRVVVRKSNQEGWQTKQIKEYIKQKTGITYSERHTVRIAQKWGLTRKTPGPQYAYAKKQDKDDFLKEKH